MEHIDKMVTTKGDKKQCIIASKVYNDTFVHFMALLAEAQEDFPELEYKDVKIKVYTGQFHKGQNGIEFSVTNDVPDDYKEVSDKVICRMYPTA